MSDSTSPSTKRTIRIGSQRDEGMASIPMTESGESPETMPPAPNAFATSETYVPTIPTPDEAERPAPAPLRDAETSLLEPPPVPQKPNLREVDPEVDEQLAAAIGEVAIDDLLGVTPKNRSARQTALADELPVDSRAMASVVKISRDTVFFSLGGPHQGVAPLRQFLEPPEVGSRFEVVIQNYSWEDGLYEVSVPGAAVVVEDWSDLAAGIVVEVLVTGTNSGGLECQVQQIRGFIPISQVSLYRVEDLSPYLQQKLPCVVTECNAARRNLVLSHRAYLERQREESRQTFLQQLEVGQIREGVVRRIQDFGAFIELAPGIDGLLHVSRLSWDRIKHPQEVLEEGQRVRVKVEKVDPQTGKISLSYRDLTEQPWAKADAQFPIGAIVQGTVSRIMDFGAFVRLAPGIEGLIHVSELSHKRVNRVQQVVQENQEVEVKILSLDLQAQRIGLSLKGAQKSAESETTPDEGPENQPTPSAPRRPPESLKGGLGTSSGGEQFGLKW